MKNGIGKRCERRPAGIERVLVAAAHDQKLAALGRLFAAAQRNVEQRNAGRPAQRFASLRMVAGATVEAIAMTLPSARAGERAIVAEHHRLDFGIEAHRDDGEIARRRHRLRRIDRLDAVAGGGLHDGQRDIIAGHREAALTQQARHRHAHLAEPDHPMARISFMMTCPAACYSRVAGE